MNLQIFKTFWGVPFLSLLLVGPAQAQLEKLTPYQPHTVSIPKGKEYLTPEGAVLIVGNDGMTDIVNRFNALFVKTHSGVKFQTDLLGSSTGIPGLTAGVSALAPMAREATPGELVGFREMFGRTPLDVYIGFSGHGPRSNGKTPPSLYMNVKNPLAGLTMEQAARIYTTVEDQNDLTTWGQLGLTGEWKDQPIHLYGTSSGGGVLAAIRVASGNLPLKKSIAKIDDYDAVLKAVAADPYGIGVTGWVDAAAVTPDVKVIPMARRDGDSFMTPTYDDVWAGRYPLSVYLRFYVKREPGKPLDPVIKEYLRMVLSREGQTIIDAQHGSVDGYVPLNPAEIAEELSKLN